MPDAIKLCHTDDQHSQYVAQYLHQVGECMHKNYTGLSRPEKRERVHGQRGSSNMGTQVLRQV